MFSTFIFHSQDTVMMSFSPLLRRVDPLSVRMLANGATLRLQKLIYASKGSVVPQIFMVFSIADLRLCKDPL